jgi:uncharacterized protein (DUF2141 family)
MMTNPQKMMRCLALLFLLFGVATNSSFSQDRKPLKITFTGLKDTKSVLMIGIYRKQDGFPGSDKPPFKGYTISPSGSSSTFTATDLEYGEYALAVYQDKNADKKLNTGMFGIPKEPYAFSNNFKPKFSGPKYDDCKFTYSAEKNELSIALLD